jgi:hypothetical protein
MSVVGYIVGGVVVALILLWVLVRASKYKQVFADAHFLEVANELPELKARALAQADQPLDTSRWTPQDETRRLITSAGLVVVYTIAPDGDQYVHHLSVSLRGGYTAHAVGDMFIWWLLRLLGVDIQRCRLLISQRTVHYAIWQVDREEQAVFANCSVAEPSAADVAGFRQEWMRSEQSVRWERFTVRI